MDSNKLVQSFIDLCSRHEEKFYKFVHEVHIHDEDLLFTHLMKWIELILSFLRNGLPTHIDMNALVFETAFINQERALKEIDALIQWNKDRKEWNECRLRAKMAIAGESTLPQGGFSVADFGLDEDEVLHLQAESSEGEYDSDKEEEGEERDEGQDDFLEMGRTRNRRSKGGIDETNRSSEPPKPEVVELVKLVPLFVDRLRNDLSRQV